MAWQSSVLAGVLFLTPIVAHGAPCRPEALGVFRTIEVGTQGGLQLGLKTYGQSLALEDREVVLTFDDGPSAQTTPKILDALAAECVTASFFLIGRNAEALPSIVKREIAEGHTVGHHTFSHPAQTLRQMSEEAAKQEILKGFEADDKAAYGTASGAPKVRFFRFPGFADTPELVSWLSAQNIAVFGADLWASDWLNMTPEHELALVLARLDKEKRGILLLHDTKPQTAAMLPALLRELKLRGYKIVALAPGANLPPTRAAPAGWTSETEKIIGEVFAKWRRAAKPRSPAPEGVPVVPTGSPRGAAQGSSESQAAPTPQVQK
ncbi:MAG TPA: polysaccharide deacetylase family protein [Methylocella sp.]|nr:polysaccharide deacetylase family protein [Methylocella sp.]